MCPVGKHRNVGPSLIVSLGPCTGGQVWTHRSAEGHVLSANSWTPINGKIPHRTLPYHGHRTSVVLFTHSAAASKTSAVAVAQASNAGLPTPGHPAVYVPTLEELKYINMGTAPAVRAFAELCTSTMEMAALTEVPKGVHPAYATQDTAKRMVEGRSVGFMHRAILHSLFYAALILTTLQSTAAAAAVSSASDFCGLNIVDVHRSMLEQASIDQLTTSEWDPSDAYVGACDTPQQLLQPWFPPLQSDYSHLKLLDCTLEAM